MLKENFNFNDIQQPISVNDKIINHLTSTELLEKIRSYFKETHANIRISTGGVEKDIVYNENRCRIEVNCPLTIYKLYMSDTVELPEWFSFLYFDHVILDSDDNFNNIKNMPQHCKHLAIKNNFLKTLEGMPSDVSELLLFNCFRLEFLDGIPNTVTYLRIDACDKLRSLEGIEQLELTDLVLGKLSSLHSLYGLEHPVLRIGLSSGLHLVTPSHVVCYELKICHYDDKINGDTIRTLPKCARFLVYNSNVESLQNLSDDVRVIYIDNTNDIDSFVLEKYLPSKLEKFYIMRYNILNSYFERTTNPYIMPKTLKKLVFGNIKDKKIQDAIVSHFSQKTNAKINFETVIVPD